MAIDYDKLERIAGSVKQKDVQAAWKCSKMTAQKRIGKGGKIEKMTLEQFEILCQLMGVPETLFFSEGPPQTETDR